MRCLHIEVDFDSGTYILVTILISFWNSHREEQTHSLLIHDKKDTIRQYITRLVCPK